MEFEKIRAIIADAMNIDEDVITMETTFKDDLGADSLDLYQIVLDIEKEFSLEIPEEALETIETVSDAVTAIKNIKS